MAMSAVVQRDYDELQNRIKQNRIAELIESFDERLLAAHIADLESEKYELVNRIEDLEYQNEVLTDKAYNQAGASAEMAKTVASLSDLLTLAERDRQVADIAGDPLDERLQAEVLRETDKLIELAYNFITNDDEA